MMRRTVTRLLAPTVTTLCVLVAAATLPLTAQADAASSTSSRAGGPKLKADYRFDGNLKSSVSGAPRLRNVGDGNVFRRDRVPGEGRTKVLKFPNGNGLKVHTKGLIPSSHYSVVMQFRLASAGTDAYARILNATLPADDNDNGLYLYNNYLVWYDDTDVSGTVGTVTPEKYVEVAFTRNTTGKIRAYVNGQPDITYADADNQAVIQNHLLRFFVDNSNEESSKGAVSRIRLWNDALGAKKVARIYTQGH
jgi:hypothetical protein